MCENVEFNRIFEQINATSLVSGDRCYMLYQLANQTKTLNGDVAEVGVYTGGTAKLFSNIFKEKQIHLFDTFNGMPETCPIRDTHKYGDFKDTSLEQVKQYLIEFSNVKFYSGIFPDTAVDELLEKQFSFVHIDADIYKSVLDSCYFFYGRLVPGAIMVFDDYGFESCPGAKLAVDEFFTNKNEQIIYLTTGQCFIIKL